MLLFIFFAVYVVFSIICFNTSHVTLYQVIVNQRRQTRWCFNTSHVTLYLNKFAKMKSVVECFNTSHVTLYLTTGGDTANKRMFQYISCYSLSIDHVYAHYHSFVSIHLMLLFIKFENHNMTFYSVFQYISCYSLSARQNKITQSELRFNTSHVTLYRGQHGVDDLRIHVSIHLMLLFIKAITGLRCMDIQVSIHLMLLFIDEPAMA